MSELASPTLIEPAFNGDSPARTLRPEQVEQIERARALGRKVRRAVRVASVDAWSIGIFGAITALTSITDVSGLALGVAMVAASVVEFRGSSQLRKLNADAARRLGYNQIVLALALVFYAAWSLYTTLNGPGPFASVMAQGGAVADMIRPYDAIARHISIAVYITLIAVAVFVQGGTAVYYFTRVKHIRAYVAQTPAWIIELQKTGVTI